MRQQFEMTQADLDRMIDAIESARRTSGMFLSGGQPMSDVQETANSAWAALGGKMGFDGATAQPVAGLGARFFTAVPTAALSQSEKA